MFMRADGPLDIVSRQHLGLGLCACQCLTVVSACLGYVHVSA